MVTKVAILDGREVWSAGAAALVRNCHLDLVGVWPDSEAASAGLTDKRPDVVILSASLIEILWDTEFARASRRPAIILVMEANDWLCENLSHFPFDGLIFRDTPASGVEACLRSVAAGHAWLDPAIFHVMAEGGSHHIDWTCLSRRQLEIANLAARGISNKAIANALHLSNGTVKMHMHHILSKLHVAHREQLNGGVASLGNGSLFMGEKQSENS